MDLHGLGKVGKVRKVGRVGKVKKAFGCWLTRGKAVGSWLLAFGWLARGYWNTDDRD